MTAAHRRHDMIDAVWERLRPHLGGDKRLCDDNRRSMLEHRSSLARFAPGLRRLEEHPPPLLPLAGPGCVGRWRR